MRIDDDLSTYSVISVTLGSISLFLWLIPILNIWIAPIGVYTGVRGYDSEKGNYSKAGIYFSIIGFIFTLLRSAYVYLS